MFLKDKFNKLKINFNLKEEKKYDIDTVFAKEPKFLEMPEMMKKDVAKINKTLKLK